METVIGKKRVGALDRLAARAASVTHQEAPTVQIPLDKVDFDPNQPRIAFHAVDGMVAKCDEEALAELAESIRVNGLIHPITVSETPDGRYLVRVGERRTRASKLLGVSTIEARVRNDLTGMRALALQMAENTDRQALSDLEIALTVRRFITKSPENPEPMTGREVAAVLGKSPGFVTRYLAFGNNELQKKWVAPNYVNTVETMYQITLLPAHIQELAYAELSTGKMEPPLSWRGLQYYKNLAKHHEASKGAGASVSGELVEPVIPEPYGLSVVPGSDEQVDLIAAAMAGADAEGNVSGLGPVGDDALDGGSREAQHSAASARMWAGDESGPAGSPDGYVLPGDVADDLRVATFQAAGDGGPSAVRSTPRVMVNSAVPCRMPMQMLGNLLTRFGATIDGMDKIEAEFRVPSAVAVNLVRELTGETVAEDRVQVMLAKALDALR